MEWGFPEVEEPEGKRHDHIVVATVLGIIYPI
jgi:hypothetical protein